MVAYDFGYWNGGQRPRRDLREAWANLVLGSYTPLPLAVLGVSEVSDQIPNLQRCADDYGLGLILGPDRVPDGRKEAILYNPALVEPRGELVLTMVGRAFQGRRHGRRGRVRMANKYAFEQEFVSLDTGWSPTHIVSHVWPSVSLQKREVRGMVDGIARRAAEIKGTVLVTMDANMEPGSSLLEPMDATDLVNSQDRYGPVPTFGGRAIDQGFVRESPHYRMTGQRVINLPGRERGGDEHLALIVEGQLTKRRGWIRPA